MSKTPLHLEVDDATLIQTNLLPADTLWQVSQRRDAPPVEDETEATKLLTQGDGLFMHKRAVQTTLAQITSYLTISDDRRQFEFVGQRLVPLLVQ